MRQGKFFKRHSAIILAATATLLGLSSCGQPGQANQSASNAIPTVQHVAIIVLENANYDDVVGQASMPYFNALIHQGGLASNYYANHHPSLPNYVVLTAGTSPITTDESPVIDIDNAARALQAAGKSWKAYVGHLPQPWYQGPDSAPFYYRAFDAFTYYSDVQPPSAASQNIVDLSTLPTDLSNQQLPAYSFIIPDSEQNGHTCPGETFDCDVSVRLGVADTWLSQTVPTLLADPEFQRSGLLLITTDESRTDSTQGGGHVAMVILGTGVKAGFVATTNYDHRSLFSLSLKALGLQRVPNGAELANQMNEFFVAHRGTY